MIYSLDSNNFGFKIRKIRKKLGLSLYDVSEKTGLKRQTISNIERDKCIPRIDTLDILSNVYKVNIYKLFDESRKVHDFIVLYKKLDQIITTLDLSDLTDICNEIKNLVQIKKEKNNNFISDYELENINYFIEYIDKIYHSKDISLQEINKVLLHLDINDMNNINETYLNNRLFTFLEYRLLMVLSMLLIQFKKYKEGIILLNHCLENISNFVFDEISELHLQLKIYLNISYINYLKGNYLKSLEYANQGINLATKKHSSFLLSQLFARRSVAKLKLKQCTQNIEEDYIKSIALFYINSQTSLTDIYVDIFSRQYNLKSEILDNLKKYIIK